MYQIGPIFYKKIVNTKKGADDDGGIVTSSDYILKDVTSDLLRSNCIY